MTEKKTTWTVKLTVGKNVEANTRAQAKAQLIDYFREQICGTCGQHQPVPFTFCSSVGGQPILIDVSASKVRK